MQSAASFLSSSLRLSCGCSSEYVPAEPQQENLSLVFASVIPAMHRILSTLSERPRLCCSVQGQCTAVFRLSTDRFNLFMSSLSSTSLKSLARALTRSALAEYCGSFLSRCAYSLIIAPQPD